MDTQPQLENCENGHFNYLNSSVNLTRKQSMLISNMLGKHYYYYYYYLVFYLLQIFYPLYLENCILTEHFFPFLL